MASAWIEHIRDFAKRNGVTYGCALSDKKCAAEYKKMKSPPPEKKVEKRQKKNLITFSS
jgi:hypothetical protein